MIAQQLPIALPVIGCPIGIIIGGPLQLVGCPDLEIPGAVSCERTSIRTGPQSETAEFCRNPHVKSKMMGEVKPSGIFYRMQDIRIAYFAIPYLCQVPVT